MNNQIGGAKIRANLFLKRPDVPAPSNRITHKYYVELNWHRKGICDFAIFIWDSEDAGYTFLGKDGIWVDGGGELYLNRDLPDDITAYFRRKK